MDIIGDVWGFSVETLTGVTPSWKTELNRSISVVEDGISGGLQHCHEMYCKKGGCRGRRACMVRRWFHRGDVISRQMDLYMTTFLDLDNLGFSLYAILSICHVVTTSDDREKSKREVNTDLVCCH